MPDVTDKYLPNVTETTVLNDLDLLYITGASTGDYKVLFQNMRKVLNPCFSTVAKSSSYVVTTGDCIGKWFSNKTASGTISFSLPAVSSGLSICFVVEASQYLTITPQAGDKIASLGSDGQSIRSNTLGNTIVLRATDDDWYIISKRGTWSAV